MFSFIEVIQFILRMGVSTSDESFLNNSKQIDIKCRMVKNLGEFFRFEPEEQKVIMQIACFGTVALDSANVGDNTPRAQELVSHFLFVTFG